MRFVRRLFYQPKHAKAAGGDASIYRSLAPSLAGMALCTVCLCGTSWAWFTATVTTEVGTIQAASCDVDVSVKAAGDENFATCVKSDDGTTAYTFPAAGTYSVRLTLAGTATTGYCKLELELGSAYYTSQLRSTEGGKVLTFTINCDANQTLIVTPQWGTYSSTADISDGDSIGVAVKSGSENDEYSEDDNVVSVSLEDESASVEAAVSLPAEDKTEESAASMLNEQPSSDSSANDDSLTDQEIASTAVVDGLSQAESASVK